ncbi:hypothetical protein [Kineosporia succinea]|uniref:Lipoprotein LpqN n=1 Tax=Kineosporia succinea TaxID=84632 RepID=A0ABT9P1R9_9ACTN|nr:hypothetical protein [Kineosporia succinea]MDP9826608.1 hypothetical protein [Kineosporia succinea]
MRALVVAVLLFVLSGCITDVGVRDTAAPVNDGRTQVLPVSGLAHHTESTGALHFEMPDDVPYEPESSGTDVRTWRTETDEGWCIVIAGSQEDFRGAFPAAAIAAFGAGREPGGVIEVNEPVGPVPGTVAGVSQRSRYPLGDGSTQGLLVVRQYLTDDGTLISLNTAGPVNALETCRLEEIPSTLRAGEVSE